MATFVRVGSKTKAIIRKQGFPTNTSPPGLNETLGQHLTWQTSWTAVEWRAAGKTSL